MCIFYTYVYTRTHINVILRQGRCVPTSAGEKKLNRTYLNGFEIRKQRRKKLLSKYF